MFAGRGIQPRMNILKKPLLLICITLASASFSQKQIKLEGASSLEGNPRLGKNVKLLKGNVHFSHDKVHMYCDSAILYPNNTVDAYGNVHIQQGDTLNLYGEALKYNGNTRKAEVQKNIRLSDKDMTLTTDMLFYDLKAKVANYSNGGTIVSKNNNLTSQYGYYHSDSKMFSFKKNVVLTNPEYIMTCDTLLYNTRSKVAYFLGPTIIKSSQNKIYCENGWYDTNKDVSQYSRNAYILTREQKLFGDSLYYDRKKGYGKAMRNVSVTDSAQNLTISGNVAEYFEKKDVSVVTGNALFRQVYDKDTLYLHADTLKATSEKNKLSSSVNWENKEGIKDTTVHRIMFAYHKVKFYKKDLQGKCDSLVYTYRDSVMRLFRDPVLWSEKNQLTAERIEIKTGKGKIESMDLTNSAFIISQEDTLRYNQIKGKTMHGFFADNKLHKIKVEGNGQTIYYAKDKNKMIGVNKADCSDLLIQLKENEVEKITFITKPDATLFPVNELSPNELRLKDFTWKGKDRPLQKKDIFTWK